MHFTSKLWLYAAESARKMAQRYLPRQALSTGRRVRERVKIRANPRCWHMSQWRLHGFARGLRTLRADGGRQQEDGPIAACRELQLLAVMKSFS